MLAARHKLVGAANGTVYVWRGTAAARGAIMTPVGPGS
jgi:hypothetical protein